MDEKDLPFSITAIGTKDSIERLRQDMKTLKPLSNEELQTIRQGGNMSNNGKPQYDFSDEYESKTVDLGMFLGHPFFVTVQEIPHGKYTQLQRNFIGKMHLTDNAQAHKKQLEEKEIDPIEYVDNRSLAGIRSWTLREKDGTPIPVGQVAWELLPNRLTALIEKAIAEVNPTLEADFREELVDTTGDLGEPSQEG